jgi:hypothetical protein
VGLLVAGCCGCGYLGAFYSTQGFADTPALEPLFRGGYLNVVIGLGALLLGVALAVAGLILVLVNRRRG